MLTLPPLPPGWTILHPENRAAPQGKTILIDPVSPHTGTIIEDIEVLIYELRRRWSPQKVGIHITYWLMGFAYGEGWEVDFLLYHVETFQSLWNYFPSGEPLTEVEGWKPPPGWQLLSASFYPSLSILASVNAYLSTLQTFRRSLPNFMPEESSLYRTTAGERTYLHLTTKEIQKYEAAL
ncbi:MAG: hypothetical protein NZ989_09095 [Bacteroidia bacterium]|nr:hypothetical protein [Bacteroidia bacterium]MDW8057870.1 hypothetical protein [Bacteroidia bacterium]